MHVLVRHDDTMGGDEPLDSLVTAIVESVLDRRVADSATVEVRLADERGVRPGGDVGCRIEVRGGGAPAVVVHRGATLAIAVHVAAEKLARALDVQPAARAAS